MNRPSHDAIALFSGCVAVSAFLLALMFGTSPVGFVLVGVVPVAVIVAALSWRAGSPVPEHRVARRWWQFLAAGGGLLLVIIAVENSPWRVGENSADGRWFVSFYAATLGVVFLVVGLVLSVCQLFSRRSARAGALSPRG